jgi:hypothetical protein
MRNECLEERMRNEYFRKVPFPTKCHGLLKHGPFSFLSPRRILFFCFLASNFGLLTVLC